MNANGNGNEAHTTTQFLQDNDNVKGGVPMNPVLLPEMTSPAEAMVQQLDTLVGAARTAKFRPATWRRAAANARPVRTRLDQPLLFVGLGGSGRQIATRLKATFIERFGHVPENAVILAFDSAEDPVSVREGRRGRVVTLEAGSEFFLLDRVPLAGMRRTPERHPDVVARLGDDLRHIRRTSIQDGAAGERTQGLLSLIWNILLITRQLETVIRRLVERSDDLRHDVTGRGGINVVIAGSTCGGQNSGGMVDLTYLVREALQAVGELGESSRVIGLVVLPGAFPGVHGPNFDPNTHAFSVELDYLQAGGGFQARYPGGIQISNKEPLFDLVFVFDGVDERGKAFANHEEVCELAAQTIGLLLSTDVGAREIFTAVNEGGVLQGVSPAGRGTYLGTAGQAIIRFPAGATADRCTVRLAGEIAEACLAAAAPEPTGAVLTGAHTLRERLGLNAQGAPLDVQMTAPASLEQAPVEEQPTLVRTYVTHFLQRRVYGDAFSQISKTATGLTNELAAEIANGSASVLAGGRLAQAAGWLGHMEAALQAEHAAVRVETERLAAALESNRKTLEAAGVNLDRAAEALFFLRKGQMRVAANRYLDEAAQYARLALSQRVAEAASEVLLGGLRTVRGRIQQVTAAQTRLLQARSLLAGREAELARLAVGRSEINLATPDLVEQLYGQYRGQPADLALQVAGQDTGVLGWGELAVETLARRLTEAATPSFALLREISVEDVLAIRWDERSAGQWISRLTGLAAGAWNQDRALMPDGGASQASFLTLGVPDATESIFANSGYTLVSTHDPERIVALRTVYGASFDTLKGAAGWQRAYDAARRKGTPLHVVRVE
jgi:hypothetical protein